MPCNEVTLNLPNGDPFPEPQNDARPWRGSQTSGRKPRSAADARELAKLEPCRGVQRQGAGDYFPGRLRKPSNLESLEVGRDFSSLQVSWPATLNNLSLGLPAISLKGVMLPDGLRSLTLPHKCRKSLKELDLPSSLQDLTLRDRWNRSLRGVNLPANLRTLKFGSDSSKAWKGYLCPSPCKACI